MVKIIDRKRLSALFNSLRFQLMLYFVAVSVIVLAVGSYLSYRNMLEMLKQRNEELVLQQFAQAEQNILNLMAEIDRLSGVFLLVDDVQYFLEMGPYSPSIYEYVQTVRNIQKKVDEIIVNYPYIDSIYLFKENREVVGNSKKNSLIVRGDQKEHPFYSTILYERVKLVDSQSGWYGGFTRDFFDEARKLNNDAAGNLITEVKGVRSRNNTSRNGVLVFNADEGYLFSLYGALGNNGEGDTYIVDGNGRILSGGYGGKVGETSAAFSSINKTSAYGSITLREDQSSRQLIYYKLASLDWFILREVPLKIDSEYSLSLQRTFVITLLLSIFAIFIATFFWLKKVTQPLNKLARKMEDVGQGNLGLTLKHIPKNELGVVIKRFNDMSVSIAELIRKNEAMEKEKRELEIEALQAQINPHFLYNTLNMIKWMAAVINAKNIVDSIVALGNILRPIYKSTDTMCTLKEEILYMENYVKIMNWRFGNGIKLRMHVAELLLDYKVPRFILQPLIENSIIHGLKNGEGLLDIDIEMMETKNDLTVIVTDTGAGIPSEKLDEINRLLLGTQTDVLHAAYQENQGIGIMNVNRRIRLYSGEGYGIRMECPADGGTKAILKIAKAL